MYTLGGILPQALNVLLLPVYTRYLSREDFGILSYTSALCVFSSILGSLMIQSYLLKRYFELERLQERARLFGSVFGFLGLYNAVLLAVEFAVLPWAFRSLGVRVSFSPYMQLALLRTALEVMAIVPLSYFRAHEEAGKFVAFSAGALVLSAGGSLVFIVGAGQGVLGWFYGQLVAYGLMLVVGSRIIARASRISLDLAGLRPALRFCLPLVPAQCLGSLQVVSDRVILERYVSVGDLGVYAVALAIASGIQIVSNGAFKALEPSVYSLASASALDAKIIRIRNYFLLLVLAVGSVLIALSREIVAVLAGPAFREAHDIVPLLVVAIAVGGLANLRSLYLIAGRTPRYESPIRGVGAVASVLALAILVPRFGTAGAPLGAIASSLCSLALFAWAARREGATGWGIAHDLGILAGGFALSFAAVSLHTADLFDGVVYKLALIAVPIGAAIWWVTRMQPEPREV